MTARASLVRTITKPAPVVVHVHDDAGRLLGRVEGQAGSVRWRAFRWDDGAGEYRAVPGIYPGESSARTALARASR